MTTVWNCHFCNKNTTKPKPYKQGWICPDPYCSQYNGFNQNGDYNLNIINEFAKKQTPHCKPSNIPFKVVNNVFQSNIHLTPNTYIPSQSSAPLCQKCQKNQLIIQSYLRNFDAGANSNYKAFTQYRQLLEDKYPICNYCKSQCKYQLNTINHNARLWQKYEDRLPNPTNINIFKIEQKINNTNTYCCSSFIRCIIHSLLLYLSFFISVIGLSNYCETFKQTSPDLINKCNIQLFQFSCQDVKHFEYYAPCLYIHKLNNEMNKYFLFNAHYIILSMIVLLFTFITYDNQKHNCKWYILLILSCILLILIPIIDPLFLNIPFSMETITCLQIGMFVVCLLFLICTCGRNIQTNRKPKINPFLKPKPMAMDSKELLNLLEEQEQKDKNGKSLNSFQRQDSKSVEQKYEHEHTPFFPSFGDGKNNGNKNKMSEWTNVNDPFQKHNNNYSYSNETINPFYGSLVVNNNSNNARSNVNNGRVNHEPMDVCDTPNKSPKRKYRNINSVSDGIHTLDLNGTF